MSSGKVRRRRSQLAAFAWEDEETKSNTWQDATYTLLERQKAMFDGDRVRLEILAREAEAVGLATRTLFLTSERLIALGLVVIAGGLTYGIGSNRSEVFLVLPFGILAVLAYGIHIWTELQAYGGYRCHLEESVNALLDRNVLLWESHIVPAQRRAAIDIVLLYVVYSAVGLFSVALGLVTAWREFAPWVFVLMCVLILGFGIPLLMSIAHMRRTFKYTYELATRVFAGRVPPIHRSAQ